MDYIKKVLMLRRTDATKSNEKPLSVLARIEIENGMGEFYISAINLPNFRKSTNYYALLVDEKGKEFEFDLGCRPTSFIKTFYELPSVKEGLAIGLYYLSEQIPIVIAFACQGGGICLQEFKKLVADKCLIRFKQSVKEEQDLCSDRHKKSHLNQDFLDEEVLAQYNDEAVATENYYELDNEIKQKLASIKENDSENLFFENEFAYNSNEKTKKEKCSFYHGAEDEENACECKKYKDLAPQKEQSEYDKKENYYEQVKDELEQIFYSYQREEGLEKVFSESKWAKIFYSKDKFYVVGLIYEENKEKYICYGVPSIYSKTPPKQLEGYCSFIPLSVFDMFGEGYFIMFQDAITGKCVHFN